MASRVYRPGELFRRHQAVALANAHQNDENNVEEFNVSTDIPSVDQASAPAISSTPMASRRPNNNNQKTTKRITKTEEVCLVIGGCRSTFKVRERIQDAVRVQRNRL